MFIFTSFTLVWKVSPDRYTRYTSFTQNNTFLWAYGYELGCKCTKSRVYQTWTWIGVDWRSVGMKNPYSRRKPKIFFCALPMWIFKPLSHLKSFSHWLHLWEWPLLEEETNDDSTGRSINNFFSFPLPFSAFCSQSNRHTPRFVTRITFRFVCFFFHFLYQPKCCCFSWLLLRYELLTSNWLDSNFILQIHLL